MSSARGSGRLTNDIVKKKSGRLRRLAERPQGWRLYRHGHVVTFKCKLNTQALKLRGSPGMSTRMYFSYPVRDTKNECVVYL